MSWILDEEVLAVLTAILVVSSIFAAAQALNAGRVVEPFSELGLLGPNMKIGDYPSEVVSGVPYRLHLYIGNHEGRTIYYRILIKVGNKSSAINSTVPLDAQPMMEYRIVLPHNSSTTVPLNITLWKPGLNRRLVFEMWIFNETSGDFVYHGRWNQLWLNVTKSALHTPSQHKPHLFPKEYEGMLAKAFLAVRKAETSGGDITEMVSLLNTAINYAMERKSPEEIEDIIQEILSLEPKVSLEGTEARNRQLAITIACIGAIAGSSIILFYTLKDRIFLYWSRLRWNWIIHPNKSEKEISSPEKKILNFLRTKKNVKVGTLIMESEKLGFDTKESAKILFKMVRHGKVRLVNPNNPENFRNFIFSSYALEFWIVTSITALTIISIYVPSLQPLRYVLGSIFVLFIPGYSLIEALYPKESDLQPLERLALSIGLSLAIVPLVGLILNYTPFGIRLQPVVISLTLLTLSLLIISSYRRFTLQKISAKGSKTQKYR